MFIETTLTWVFTVVALVGLVVQLWAEVWGGHLPDRLHPPEFYIRVGVGGLVAIALLVWALTGVGNWTSRSFEPVFSRTTKTLPARGQFVSRYKLFDTGPTRMGAQPQVGYSLHPFANPVASSDPPLRSVRRWRQW